MDKRSLFFVLALSAAFLLVNTFFLPSLKGPATEQVVSHRGETPSHLIIPTSTIDQKTDLDGDESFYVLENEFQQLVFSTRGGALAEINLPFASQTSSLNPVREIGFDQEILKDSPQNALFPLHDYTVFEGGQMAKKSPKQGGYTPLLRRTIVQNASGLSIPLHPQYYALTLVSSAPVSQVPYYTVSQMGSDFITFSGKSGEQTITKTYRFIPNAPYTFSLEIALSGGDKISYLTSGIPEVELISGSASPLLRYLSKQGKERVEKLSLPKNEVNTKLANPLWVSNSNGFFGLIMNPLQEIDHIQTDRILGTEIPTRLTLIDAEYDLYPAKNYPGYEALLPVQSKGEPLSYRIYAGPYDAEVLKHVDQALVTNPNMANPHFDLAVAFQGWFTFISEPFAKFLYIIMQFFYLVTGSWGISIILLTLVLRVILFPLNTWSFKSNAKLQKLGPKLKNIQEKFKKDPKRLQMETAMLYKTEGVNPFSGCLPILVQIPFFIAMFDLLKSIFALRGASFIPGWIDNLTAPDAIFSWSYPIPFIGNSLHLLPIILAGLMFLQSKMNALWQDPKAELTDQQKQLKSMGNIMTVAFLFIFYNMPSGLNIYFIFSTIFGMMQQWFIMNRMIKKNGLDL